MAASDSTHDSEIVSVTKHGQATIPKRFREKLGIDAPGRVAFRETEEGAVVVERVASPEEMRGFAARESAETDAPASAILQADREEERNDRVDE